MIIKTDEELQSMLEIGRICGNTLKQMSEALEPGMVLPGSTKRVWWRCSDGHEWKAVVYSRTGAQKCGCPVCAGKRPRIYLEDKIK